MALIRCEQCGKEISDTMNACPFCGKTFKKEDVSDSFHVADLKAVENKPLMKEICTHRLRGYGGLRISPFAVACTIRKYCIAPLLGTNFYAFIPGLFAEGKILFCRYSSVYS